MNIAGKITKGVLFATGGIGLVLFAVFIYINNDLGSSSFVKSVEKEVVGNLPGYQVTGDGSVQDDSVIMLNETDVSQPQSDAQLDAVFDFEEPVDNFDDLVE